MKTLKKTFKPVISNEDLNPMADKEKSNQNIFANNDDNNNIEILKKIENKEEPM